MYLTAVTTAVLTTQLVTFLVNPTPSAPEEVVLASHEMSLQTRQADPVGNEAFKDNILLNLAYMRGIVHPSAPINWEEIRQPFSYEMELKPGEVFTFHDQLLPEFESKVTKNSAAHFNTSEGFKVVYGLPGNGVCHLASLVNWVTKDAGFETVVPSNHDFAAIPEIDKSHGVAIYNNPSSPASGARQNLYITNTKSHTITFRYAFDGEKLRVTLVEKH